MNHQKAIAWYRSATWSSDKRTKSIWPRARFKIGRLLDQGKGTLAVELQNHPRFEAGVRESKDPLDAHRRGMDDIPVMADDHLAFLSRNNPAVDERLVGVIPLFEAASRGRFAQADYDLGLLYFSGRGVKKDGAKAQAAFERAAAKGHLQALCTLFSHYDGNARYAEEEHVELKTDRPRALEVARKIAGLALGDIHSKARFEWDLAPGGPVPSQYREVLKAYESPEFQKGATGVAVFIMEDAEDQAGGSADFEDE